MKRLFLGLVLLGVLGTGCALPAPSQPVVVSGTPTASTTAPANAPSGPCWVDAECPRGQLCEGTDGRPDSSAGVCTAAAQPTTNRPG